MDNTNTSAALKPGQHVTVGTGHWNKTLHGRAGIINSITIAENGEPTAHVRNLYKAGGGEFVLIADLQEAR